MSSAGTLERLAGFGGAQTSVSHVFRPRSADELATLLHQHPWQTLALRGAGRSYGDAALNGGGAVLDVSGLDRILALDPASGIVDAEPGVTIEALWHEALPLGYWPPVVPGTMRVTLGGAVAMNIHGKNCFRAGPIGDHVLELELLLPTGERVTCGPSTSPELFDAVVGGFGMLGCIVRVRLRLERVHSGWLRVRALAARSLREMLELLEEHAGDASYLVGWCDGLAPEASLGRGVLHRADHLALGEDAAPADSLRPERQQLPSRLFGVVPRAWSWLGLRALNHGPGMRVTNAVKSLAHRLESREPRLVSHARFHFLLDYMPGWTRGYGRAGLIQIQPLVPLAAAREVFEDILCLARRRGLPPYLVVLKKHRADRFLLSHGVDGCSLAMDFPARRRDELWSLAREIQEIALCAGGRFYFAKDSTLTPDAVRRAFPPESLRRFRELKQKCDPQGWLQSDLARRVWPELFGAPEGR